MNHSNYLTYEIMAVNAIPSRAHSRNKLRGANTRESNSALKGDDKSHFRATEKQMISRKSLRPSE